MTVRFVTLRKSVGSFQLFIGGQRTAYTQINMYTVKPVVRLLLIFKKSNEQTFWFVIV